jgi:hypothetical protein
VIRLILAWLRLGVPSEQQKEIVSQVYEQVAVTFAAHPLGALKIPRSFRFSPDPDLEIGWVGSCLVIHDTLLKSRFLPALLLRELAHYNSNDVWLRLLLKLFPPPLYGLGTVVGLGIGLGPLVLYFPWIWYWRTREYAADAFVARLGHGEELLEVLENLKLPRNRERNILLREVPYAEERKERINLIRQPQITAPQVETIAALPPGPELLELPAASSTTIAVRRAEEIEGSMILGTALSGDLWEWVKEGYLIYPRRALGLHGVVIGRSGSGKTETLLRIAYLAAKIYRYQVIYLDAKGDWTLAARFRALMREAGIAEQRIGLFPNVSHNGWMGDEHDLLNKLLQSQQWNDAFYKEVAVNLLSLALNAPGGLPKSSAELLERLNPNRLMALYKGETSRAGAEGPGRREAMGRLSALLRVFHGSAWKTGWFSIVWFLRCRLLPA